MATRRYKPNKREALDQPEVGVEMRLKLPKALHASLVARARRNNRILIGEVRQILQDAMADSDTPTK